MQNCLLSVGVFRLEAQVIGIKDDGEKIRVHYKGLTERYDEDLATDEKHPDASR